MRDTHLRPIPRLGFARSIVEFGGRPLKRVSSVTTRLWKILSSRTSRERAAGRSLRVVFVSPALGLGGVDGMVLKAARLTSQVDRIAVSILAVQECETTVWTEPDDKFEVVLTRKPRLMHSLPVLFSRLRKMRPHLIVSSTPLINLAVIFARAVVAPRARLVIWDHGVLPERTEPELSKALSLILFAMKTSYRKADQLICVSRAVQEDLQRRKIQTPSEVDIIPNFVDPPATEPKVVPPGGDFVLGIGRLSWEKGLDILVEAFSQVQDTSLTLILAGAGPEESALRQQVARLGLTNSVQFAGRVSDVRGLIRSSRLVVFPSRREGFPLALLEALQEGAQVVVTDCPGSMAEIVGRGRYGTVVSAGNSSDLSRGISLALEEERPQSSLIVNRGLEFTSAKIFPIFFEKIFGSLADNMLASENGPGGS